MKVMFRTDSSIEIGTGHVMRCLTLADVLKDSGADCEFVCREHPGNQLGLIRERGYKAHALPLGGLTAVPENPDVSSDPLHASWLGESWEIDAGQTFRALDGAPADWLIVDHYALDARWEGRLKPACDKLMVIDDLADREHDCDVLLDQNLGREAGDYVSLVPQACSLLLGPNYALLRPEFAALREYSLSRRESPQIRQLLISMGGVDKDDVTSRVLQALKDCNLPDDCRICVVMGGSAPGLQRVRDLALDMPWPTQVLVDVKDMAGLMAESDLAIGAAGSTSWERCCLGLPSILIVLAENQRRIGEQLESCGAAMMVHVDTLIEELCKAVEGLFSQQERLMALTSKASVVADGLGGQRVVARLSHCR